MQTKFDKLWSLFSQNFMQCQAKSRAKFVHKTNFPGNILRYFERANKKSLWWKFAKAKICSNEKELERYKSVAVIDVTFDHTAKRSMFHFHNVKLVLKMWHDCLHVNNWKKANEKSLTSINNSLKIALCHEILLEISQHVAKYHCHANNRSPEISSKNRSKRKYANLRRIFAKFVEFWWHYCSTSKYIADSHGALPRDWLP